MGEFVSVVGKVDLSISSQGSGPCSKSVMEIMMYMREPDRNELRVCCILIIRWFYAEAAPD
jgi:hypothetical protein